MRIAAIVLNVIMLGFVAYMLFDKGMPNSSEMWLLLLFVGCPVANLLALQKSPGSKGLLALYLRRKALEEQAKIDALKTPK